MTQSEQIKKKLTEYYESAGIVPGEKFACKNWDKCPGENLCRGMQCHVGHRFGDKIKVIVASLDCGGWASDIEGRTENIYETAQKTLNPHMRGTYKTLSYFLGEMSPTSLADYFIMINTCKCSKNEKKKDGKPRIAGQMPAQYFVNCAEHSLAEISIIRPEVIIFQGINSRACCTGKLKPIQGDVDQEISKNLYFFEYGDLRCYAVLCMHPSAYGRNLTRKKIFYNETLPKIAEYIKHHPI